jgi:glycosyltransferase involved in cell wall biosynthesis
MRTYAAQVTGFSIGVVIPTYERVDETLRAVRSALNQTIKPEQVVVVDDGSESSTVARLRDELPSGRVELVSIRHTGHPGRARNAGVARLATTHVGFLDSDDEWHPQKIERQAKLIERGHPAVFCAYTAMSTPWRQPVDSHSRARTVSLGDLMSGNSIGNSTVVLDRRLLDAVGGVPVSYAVRGIEDYAAWLRVAYLTDWVGVDEDLVHYCDDERRSIRGTKECAIPERLLAQWDFVEWLRATDRPLPGAARLVDEWYPRLMGRWARRHRPETGTGAGG